MVASGTISSAANKRYKTALAASYGGAELVIKEILPTVFATTIAAGLNNPAAALATMYPTSTALVSSADVCLMQKLTTQSTQWTSAACGDTTSSDPTLSSDFRLNLSSTSAEPFTVYAKIVETACSDKRPYPEGKCTGSDLSGIDYLDSGQGTTGGTSGISVQSMPAVYRIEVRGQRLANPGEKANLSLLYAY